MKYWASSKILLGGLLVFLLIVVIWFPLLFMSFINSAYISNIPVDATFTLTVGGYQVRFYMIAKYIWNCAGVKVSYEYFVFSSTAQFNSCTVDATFTLTVSGYKVRFDLV